MCGDAAPTKCRVAPVPDANALGCEVAVSRRQIAAIGKQCFRLRRRYVLDDGILPQEPSPNVVLS